MALTLQLTVDRPSTIYLEAVKFVSENKESTTSKATYLYPSGPTGNQETLGLGGLGYQEPHSVQDTGWLGQELEVKSGYHDVLEVNGVRGFLILGDLKYLCGRAETLPENGVIVEVGSFLGLSAITMANGLIASKNYGALIYCIDKWEVWPELLEMNIGILDASLYDTFLANVRNSRVGSYIHPIKKPSVEAAREFRPNSVDLLFIDGDHSFEGTYADLGAWYPKLKPGGRLFGHDCAPESGVRSGVEKFFRERGLAYHITDPPTSHYMFEMK